jgi:nitrogen fixation/metabolism regulation signal transduction histidine kinase
MLPIRRAKKNGERSGDLPVRFEGRLLLSVILSGAPGAILSSLLLWNSQYSLDHKIEGSLLLCLLWLGLSFSTRDGVVNSLRVLSNVVSAVKDEDFCFRAKRAVPGDALGDLALEINNLSSSLAAERLDALETTHLLRKVMAEAGTIILAFSPDNRLRLVNRAGALFLGGSEEELVNRTAADLGIQDLLEGPPSEVISRLDSGAGKRWIVRRTSFRQKGRPHCLLILSEASEALRAEERLAWQRLIRVLSHEINNSLAPIQSIAHTLGRMASNTELPAPFSEHFGHGLGVIQDRAESLNRFLQNYTRVAMVPVPARRPVAILSLVTHVVTLETRVTVNVIPGPKVDVSVDADQVEQALINLIKNAADAVLLAPEKAIGPEAVTLSWMVHANDVEICIRDEGVGLSETENLFVPFYTTKETGSGIGLLLSRQIIEAHHGTLLLRNRVGRSGCEVEIKLPLSMEDAPMLNRLARQGKGLTNEAEAESQVAIKGKTSSADRAAPEED